MAGAGKGTTIATGCCGSAARFLGGAAKTPSAQRCLRPLQLGPKGIKDGLGPNVEPGPVSAQPLKGPLQLGPGALGATDGVAQQQGVVGTSSVPHHGHLPVMPGPSTSWRSSRSRWQVLQVAMILIAPRLLGWLRRSAALVDTAAPVTESTDAAPGHEARSPRAACAPPSTPHA